MSLITKIIRPEIASLNAYHVPDASGYLKLDAMENPFRLPEALRSELGEKLAEALINRYPDPSAEVVRQRLHEAMEIPAGFDVLLGNGSDELIQMLAMAIARPGAIILGVEPSFVMYRMIARFLGLEFVGVPLASDFSLDMEATLAAIKAHQPALVFLSYPNNPTGNRFDESQVSAIVEVAPGLVVVDEAYHAFADDSFMPRLSRYPNLLVMRTLSKLGLAGLRLGFLAGHPDWLMQIDKVRLPYNINVLTQTAACFALDHLEVLNQQAACLRLERARLMQEIAGMSGVVVYPSEANFLLVRVTDAEATHAALKNAGILVKKVHGSHEMLKHCLRFTIGSPEENDRVIEVLPACL